jgi:hypothetical protein
MKQITERERALATATAHLIQEVHRLLPGAVTRPMTPYEDEDFTLEITVPAHYGKEAAEEACLKACIQIEDQYGFYILPRVRLA